MNRLDEIAARKRPILACLLQPGDPALPEGQADIYAGQGVDVAEVSLPCAHPFLDGAVVTQSMQRALRAGMTQPRLEAALRTLRGSHPGLAIVVMGYRNLRLPRARARPRDCWDIDGILQIGNPAFCRRGAGIPCGARVIYRIGYVSHEMRASEIAHARRAGGYVMLQAASGRTGARRGFDRSNAGRVSRLRDAGITVPILLGFGISSPAHAREALRCGADGVIVGSACTVRALAGADKLSRFVAGLRAALDAA